MTSTSDLVFQRYLPNYLKLKFSSIKFNTKNFSCPICNKKDSATIISSLNSQTVQCFDCGLKANIFELVRLLDMSNASDEDIADYLTHLFDIKTDEQTEKTLEMYSKLGWALIPLRTQGRGKESKKALLGEWEKSEYKDINVWLDWLQRKNGLGLNLGKKSGVLAIDIDSEETYEKVKDLMGDTLVQSTKRGRHFLYVYDEAFDHIMHDNLRDKGYEMEIRVNNSYIVIAPTVVEDELRSWNNRKVSKMPKELKDFLLALIEKDKKSGDEKLQESIQKDDLGTEKLRGWDGCFDDNFVKFLGIMRKKMPMQTVEYVGYHFNRLFDEPLDSRTLNSKFKQIDKYNCFDKKELAKEVLSRMDIIKEGSAFQISKSLNLQQKEIEDVLHYLEQEGKIVPIGKNRYKKLEDAEWVCGFDDFSVPIDFTVPYFSKYAHFDQGNMIIIGAKSGGGKTHLCGNFIKGFSDQERLKKDGIDLISTESGSKIGKVLDSLNVPHSFVHHPKMLHKHPSEIELRDNRITLLDWLRPKEGDFAQFDNTLNHFHEQLKKHKGLLILFMQIRENGTFFASDQVNNFAALVALYGFGNGGKDPINTFLETKKIRDSKNGLQYITIPTKFNRETKILEERDNS